MGKRCSEVEMRRLIFVFIAVLALSLLYAQDYVPGEILVKFSPSLPEMELTDTIHTSIAHINSILSHVGARKISKVFKMASALDATILVHRADTFAVRELAYWFKLKVPVGTEMSAMSAVAGGKT